MNNEFEVDEEVTFVDYLINNMQVLTYEKYQSKMFRYFMYECYYDNYKNYCKKNNLVAEIIDFRL